MTFEMKYIRDKRNVQTIFSNKPLLKILNYNLNIRKYFYLQLIASFVTIQRMFAFNFKFMKDLLNSETFSECKLWCCIEYYAFYIKGCDRISK